MKGRVARFESMWVDDAHGGAKPGILLFPNILGTKEWDFAKAEEVAALGYTVLVADLYGQGKRGTSMESGMALMKEVSDDRTCSTGWRRSRDPRRSIPHGWVRSASALAASACLISRAPARTSRAASPSTVSMMLHPFPMCR